jgi:hypothetical protein
LFGELVSGLVILFSVVRGGSTVCVCGEFMVFGGFLVGVTWHGVSNPLSLQQLKILPFSKLFNYEHSRRAGPRLTNAVTEEVDSSRNSAGQVSLNRTPWSQFSKNSIRACRSGP